MTRKIWATKSAGTLGVPARQPCRGERDGPARVRAGEETLLCGDPLGWNRSLIELTKITRGRRHLVGVCNSLGWIVTAKPGPLVLGSPSRWYLACPIPSAGQPGSAHS